MTVPSADSERQWFALKVRSNFERMVSELLQGKAVESFLPLYRTQRVWSDRVREIEVPLFPGYVFCRVRMEQRGVVLATTGVVEMLGSQGRPLPIHDDEIAAVRKMMESHSRVEPWPFIREGQRVRVSRGALAGLEGILLKMKGSCRLLVSITLLGRSVAAEIDGSHVRPV